MSEPENEASDATAARLREQAEEIGSLRQQVEQQRSLAFQWKTKADETVKETNDLRGQLLDALLLAERLRGFIDGKRAAEPPTLVPEPVRDLDWVMNGQRSERSSFGQPTPKPWFAR